MRIMDCNICSGQDVKARARAWPRKRVGGRPDRAHGAAEVQLRTMASAWGMSRFRDEGMKAGAKHARKPRQALPAGDAGVRHILDVGAVQILDAGAFQGLDVGTAQILDAGRQTKSKKKPCGQVDRVAACGNQAKASHKFLQPLTPPSP